MIPPRETRPLTFRFDDVCINADMGLINSMTDFLFEKFPGCGVIYGVSPLVFDMDVYDDDIEHQRVFPRTLNPLSDHTSLYHVQKAGIPEMDKRVKLAGHGIVHVDHRLLHFEAQELSIVTSCSLLGAKMFIPPFNKWDADTETACKKHGIELVKFESGWLSVEHNKYNPDHRLWYLHAREFTLDEFKNWFE